jgi:proteasome lid subunit RPN8/RPN11
VLELHEEAWREILAHARRTAPEEACGILVGLRTETGFAALRAEPCRNIHPGDRTRRFLIDPGRQLAVQREARQQGLAIVGFYHSHPGGRAEPSAEDRTQAHPWTPMLIVALRGECAEARAWRCNPGGGCEETPVRIGPVTGSGPGASSLADGG